MKQLRFQILNQKKSTYSTFMIKFYIILYSFYINYQQQSVSNGFLKYKMVFEKYQSQKID